MKSFRIYSILTVLFTFMVFCGSAAAYNLYFDPSPKTATQGDIFSVNINISSVDQDPVSADFSVQYDPSILSVYGGGYGTGILGTIVPSSPQVVFDLYALDPFGPGTFTLAYITFQAVGVGESDLQFGSVEVYSDSTSDLLEGSATDGSVEVSESQRVPEPSSLLLLGLGIAGLIAGRKKFTLS
jgi:hypothetical protein